MKTKNKEIWEGKRQDRKISGDYSSRDDKNWNRQSPASITNVG